MPMDSRLRLAASRHSADSYSRIFVAYIVAVVGDIRIAAAVAAGTAAEFVGVDSRTVAVEEGIHTAVAAEDSRTAAAEACHTVAAAEAHPAAEEHPSPQKGSLNSESLDHRKDYSGRCLC